MSLTIVTKPDLHSAELNTFLFRYCGSNYIFPTTRYEFSHTFDDVF